MKRSVGREAGWVGKVGWPGRGREGEGEKGKTYFGVLFVRFLKNTAFLILAVITFNAKAAKMQQSKPLEVIFGFLSSCSCLLLFAIPFLFSFLLPFLFFFCFSVISFIPLQFIYTFWFAVSSSFPILPSMFLLFSFFLLCFWSSFFFVPSICLTHLRHSFSCFYSFVFLPFLLNFRMFIFFYLLSIFFFCFRYIFSLSIFSFIAHFVPGSFI